MRIFFLASLFLVGACAVNVPPGELERMRAQMPPEKNPPASYNEKGIGVP